MEMDYSTVKENDARDGDAGFKLTPAFMAFFTVIALQVSFLCCY
jgi:hypothetical protein